MLSRRLGVAFLAAVTFAVLEVVVLSASALGAGSFASLTFLAALPTVFFGLFLMGDWFGEREHPTDTLYVAKVRGFTMMIPRSKPEEEPRQPTVSGLRKGNEIDTRRFRWLSADSLGLGMIIAAILLLASTYVPPLLNP